MNQSTATGHYDDIVIGTGAAGQFAATAAADAGRRVAIIDRQPPGGTCAMRGCSPKKVMVNAAKLARQTRFARGQLLGSTADVIHWPSLYKLWHSFIEPVPELFFDKCRQHGIEFIAGEAFFLDEKTIAVGRQRLTAERFMIASGSRPREPDFPGGGLCIDSDAFFELRELPPRLTVIGGGYIGMEFGFTAAMAGSQVTIIDSGQILDGFEPELVRRWMATTEDLPLEFIENAQVQRVDQSRSLGPFTVSLASGRDVESDLVLFAAGRQPNLESLNLAACGVQHSPDGIQVDEWARTSNRAIWSAGDCVDIKQPALTTTAELLGRCVADQWTGRPAAAFDPAGVASTVFCYPPISAVGKLESQLQAERIAYETLADDWTEKGEIRKFGPGTPTAFRIYVDSDDHILGAHLVGPAADEQINLFALAIRHRISRQQLAHSPLAYPTFGSQAQAML